MRVQAPKPRKADEGLDVGGFVLSSAAGVAHGFLGYLKEDEALNMEKATLKKNKKSKWTIQPSDWNEAQGCHFTYFVVVWVSLRITLKGSYINEDIMRPFSSPLAAM